jgi:hypothetical protein
MTKIETLTVLLFGGIAAIVSLTGLVLIAASLLLTGALVLE